VDTEKNKDFFQSVWDVVRLIPEGRVCTYGAIAKYLGAARSSRMVGWAMNAAHDKADVPAHRVVNRVGILTGKHHFDPQNPMQYLLENEGILIVNDQIVELKSHLWEPLVELD
jgi:methylated-DNA-protein-cysteine methyltransferase related protein